MANLPFWIFTLQSRLGSRNWPQPSGRALGLGLGTGAAGSRAARAKRSSRAVGRMAVHPISYLGSILPQGRDCGISCPLDRVFPVVLVGELEQSGTAGLTIVV